MAVSFATDDLGSRDSLVCRRSAEKSGWCRKHEFEISWFTLRPVRVESRHTSRGGVGFERTRPLLFHRASTALILNRRLNADRTSLGSRKTRRPILWTGKYRFAIHWLNVRLPGADSGSGNTISRHLSTPTSVLCCGCSLMTSKQLRQDAKGSKSKEDRRRHLRLNCRRSCEIY